MSQNQKCVLPLCWSFTFATPRHWVKGLGVNASSARIPTGVKPQGGCGGWNPSRLMKSIKVDVWDCSSIETARISREKNSVSILLPTQSLPQLFLSKLPGNYCSQGTTIPSLSIHPSDPAPSSGGCWCRWILPKVTTVPATPKFPHTTSHVS